MLCGVGVQQHKHRSVAPLHALELAKCRVATLGLLALVLERAEANVSRVIISESSTYLCHTHQSPPLLFV